MTSKIFLILQESKLFKMKEILLHPDVFRAFVREAKMNLSVDGDLLQSMVYLLGHEAENVFKTTELFFPFQDCSNNFVKELGEYIFDFNQ